MKRTDKLCIQTILYDPFRSRYLFLPKIYYSFEYVYIKCKRNFLCVRNNKYKRINDTINCESRYKKKMHKMYVGNNRKHIAKRKNICGSKKIFFYPHISYFISSWNTYSYEGSNTIFTSTYILN